MAFARLGPSQPLQYAPVGAGAGGDGGLTKRISLDTLQSSSKPGPVPAPAPTAVPAPVPAEGGGGRITAPPLQPPPGAGGGMTNTAQASPGLSYLTEKYKERLGAEPTERAVNMASSQARDVASGLAKEMEADFARRGILGTGAASQELQKRVYDPLQRQIAGQSAQIALGREGDLDRMVLGGVGLMQAPEQLALAQQGLGLQQWQAQAGHQLASQQAQAQQELARQQMAMQQQQMLSNLWSTWLNNLM